jgi:antitoxin (DNA-binding transcriptional repressor) of toxin-antitoxin stability system
MMYEEEKGHPDGGEDLEDMSVVGPEQQGPPDNRGGSGEEGLPDNRESAGQGSPERADEFDPFSHLFGDPRDVAFARREARRRASEFIRRLKRRRPTAAEERRETLRRIKREGRITAVDLRRRTSEVIAALDRNEELLISHRDRWVGVITPISLIQDAGEPPPIKSSRYFGFARWAPRLRRNRNWPGYSTRVDSADGAGDRPGEQSGDRPGDEPTAPCPV